MSARDRFFAAARERMHAAGECVAVRVEEADQLEHVADAAADARVAALAEVAEQFLADLRRGGLARHADQQRFPELADVLEVAAERRLERVAERVAALACLAI